ncbi:hypothetical protein HXX76_001008 [Chlamydomonas incerta]|uniref:Uncharacterized protein n=1 Tax=Chlamydomonas incerta TaxID=51695 RepID=A0A835WBB5_CHLIN|nr:hypothetical protein HXX76_001008 [Chlamydomonas incerta]|eukprot:KAG2444251.1 hypothetical protein HXX76_001008 [Chlamydomonas incerta]
MARSYGTGRAALALLVVVGAALFMAPGATAGRLGASIASSTAESFFQPRRALLGSCIDCATLSTCIKAVCTTSDGVSTTTVALDFSGCKGSSISWFCCSTAATGVPGGCSITGCNGGPLPASGYCDTVLTSTVTVTYGATSVNLQVHDGQISGNTDCSTQPHCGGCGGSCGAGVCSGVSVPIIGLEACTAKPPSPQPPSPAPPSPKPPSFCPTAAQLSTAGFPSCGVTCTLTGAATCLVEPSANAFDTSSTWRSVLATLYSCNVKPTNTVYLAFDGVTNLDTFWANAVQGSTVGISCYDSTLTTVTSYLVVSVLPTPDNYCGLSCGYFSVAPVAYTPGACKCTGDTAWGFPTKAQFGTYYGSTVTSEIKLAVTDAGFTDKVYWTPRQQTTNAWGGFFRILPPTTSGATLTLGICAGCGLNKIDKGYSFGNGFTVTFTNFAEGNSTIVVQGLPAGASAVVTNAQVYQQFIAPPTFAPGQFKTFTAYSGTPVPTGTPLTSYPATFTASALDILTYTDSKTGITYTIPTTATANGVYLALHLDVGSYCTA